MRTLSRTGSRITFNKGGGQRSAGEVLALTLNISAGKGLRIDLMNNNKKKRGLK